MRRYHYSTWGGQRIEDDQKIFASVAYERFTGSSILNSTPLIFLTENDHWEPSVQARSVRLFWEKCGSCPEVYEELGIPCWKFEVDGRVGLPAVAYSDTDSWRRMLEDAIIMGSNPDKWYVCGGYLNVFNSWKWEKGQWLEQR